jgi:hypothetical protein
MDLTSAIFAGLNLFTIGFSAAMFIIIKFNDLHHLTTKVDDLIREVKISNDKQEKMAERVATIEGRCASNHK